MPPTLPRRSPRFKYRRSPMVDHWNEIPAMIALSILSEKLSSASKFNFVCASTQCRQLGQPSLEGAVWLGDEYQIVIEKTGWQTAKHPPGIECAVCGCNCGQCPGVPIRGNCKYEHTTLKHIHSRQQPVTVCQRCFDSDSFCLYEGVGPVVEPHDLNRIEMQPLAAELANHFRDWSGDSVKYERIEPEPVWRRSLLRHNTPYFEEHFESPWDQSARVQIDDLAVVIAYGLIDSPCQRLNLSECSEFSERGYRAFAVALEIGAHHLEELIFTEHDINDECDCECYTKYSYVTDGSCSDDDEKEYRGEPQGVVYGECHAYLAKLGVAAAESVDLTAGCFLTALEKNSSLKLIRTHHGIFGPRIVQRLQALGVRVEYTSRPEKGQDGW